MTNIQLIVCVGGGVVAAGVFVWQIRGVLRAASNAVSALLGKRK